MPNESHAQALLGGIDGDALRRGGRESPGERLGQTFEFRFHGMIYFAYKVTEESDCRCPQRRIKSREDKRLKRSIILIGMPGCGKSTVGVLLAKALCMQFLDTDLLIQKRERMPLQRIINTRGNEYFSAAEEKAVLSIRQRGQVIATGGSVALLPKAIEHLKTLGTVVYINAPFPVIRRRLWNLKTRGIVLRPDQTLEDLYRERTPHYEMHADITVRTGRMRAEEVAQEIIDKLGVPRCDV